MLDPVVACEVQEQLPLMKRGRVGAIAFEKGGQQAQQRRAFTVIAWHAATHARAALLRAESTEAARAARRRDRKA